MNIFSQSSKFEWASLTHTTPHIVKKIRRVIERTNYILDTLSTEYTPQAFMHTESFTIFDQCKGANLHDDDNEREWRA